MKYKTKTEKTNKTMQNTKIAPVMKLKNLV